VVAGVMDSSALTESPCNPLNPAENRMFVFELRINGIGQHVIRPLSIQPAGLAQGQDQLDPAVPFLALRTPREISPSPA